MSEKRMHERGKPPRSQKEIDREMLEDLSEETKGAPSVGHRGMPPSPVSQALVRNNDKKKHPAPLLLMLFAHSQLVEQ